MKPPIYDIQNLSTRYGDAGPWVNDDINLQINQGEIFGLLGENGAGKSTLIRQMVNLQQPTQGSISLLGQPLADWGDRLMLQVGYMPQETNALNMMSVGESLYFTSHLRGLTRRQAKAETQRLLDLWQLDPLQNTFSSRLSGGQRRLLHLAVAMAGQPPILILDEPTNDLDPAKRKRVWDVLRQTRDQFGCTIIFITHDALEAEKAIERVGIMKQGKLVALGAPSQLKQVFDQQLTLELVFPAGHTPVLGDGVSVVDRRAGRWLVQGGKAQVATLMQQLDLNAIDSFKLYTPTLEDLYLHFSAESQAQPEVENV